MYFSYLDSQKRMLYNNIANDVNALKENYVEGSIAVVTILWKRTIKTFMKIYKKQMSKK